MGEVLYIIQYATERVKVRATMAANIIRKTKLSLYNKYCTINSANITYVKWCEDVFINVPEYGILVEGSDDDNTIKQNDLDLIYSDRVFSEIYANSHRVHVYLLNFERNQYITC